MHRDSSSGAETTYILVKQDSSKSISFGVDILIHLMEVNSMYLCIVQGMYFLRDEKIFDEGKYWRSARDSIEEILLNSIKPTWKDRFGRTRSKRIENVRDDIIQFCTNIEGERNHPTIGNVKRMFAEVDRFPITTMDQINGFGNSRLTNIFNADYYINNVNSALEREQHKPFSSNEIDSILRILSGSSKQSPSSSAEKSMMLFRELINFCRSFTGSHFSESDEKFLRKIIHRMWTCACDTYGGRKLLLTMISIRTFW